MKRFAICVEEEVGFGKQWKPIKKTDSEITANRFIELMSEEYGKLAVFDDGKLIKVVSKDAN